MAGNLTHLQMTTRAAEAEWLHSGDSLTLAELCARSGAWADKHRPNVDGRWLQLAEETGEAIRARRHGDADERRTNIGYELADVMLVAASLADYYSIDLTEAIEHKARVHADG